jgi:anti-sigma regulatory factor (Ser/Thr protein kinase)
MEAKTAAGDVCNTIEADSTSFSIPSQLEWVGKTSERLTRRAQDCGVCDETRAGKMNIALHEAITNAIVHGNLGVPSDLKEQSADVFAKAVAEKAGNPQLAARRVKIIFDFDGCECHITVTDEGSGFDFLSWLKALDDSETEEPSELCSGRGILMMRALADQVQFSDGGRTVRMTWRAPSWAERRQSKRQPWNKVVRVIPVGPDDQKLDGASWEPVIGRNVSEHGVAIIQDAPVVSKRVLIEIQENGAPTYITADVCQMTVLDDGLVQIGCQFRPGQKNETPQDAAAVEDAAPPVVRRMLERMGQAPQHPDERRHHRRISYTATVQIRVENGEFRSAFSRDLSHGGIAVLAPFKLPLGPAEILLPAEHEGEQLLSARIVRCQRVSRGVYDIGCQFI